MHIINNARFVIRVNKKYYPQTLLEKCKYVIRKNKIENLINNDLSLSSSDEVIMNLIINLLRVIMNLIINLIMNLITDFDNDKSSDYLLKNKIVF